MERKVPLPGAINSERKKYFRNQKEAARQLARMLRKIEGDSVIFTLPRSFVLGFNLAQRLKLPLSVVAHEEIGHLYDNSNIIAVVAPDGHLVKNSLDELFIDGNWFDRRIEEAKKAASQQSKIYSSYLNLTDIRSKTVILVDDEPEKLAFSLAILEISHLNPKKIIAALPVIPHTFLLQIRECVDDLYALETPLYKLEQAESHYFDPETIDEEEILKILSSYPYN